MKFAFERRNNFEESKRPLEMPLDQIKLADAGEEAGNDGPDRKAALGESTSKMGAGLK